MKKLICILLVVVLSLAAASGFAEGMKSLQFVSMYSYSLGLLSLSPSSFDAMDFEISDEHLLNIGNMTAVANADKRIQTVEITGSSTGFFVAAMMGLEISYSDMTMASALGTFDQQVESLSTNINTVLKGKKFESDDYVYWYFDEKFQAIEKGYYNQNMTWMETEEGRAEQQRKVEEYKKKYSPD